MNARILSLVLLVCACCVGFASAVDENTRSGVGKPVISRIPHTRVASTAISSIGYSKRRHILEIEFMNGAMYRYLEIMPSVYRELMLSDSKARYYDWNIKGNYISIRMRGRTLHQR